MKPAKRASPPSKKYPPGSFMGRLKERKIIATLAAFAGSGVVIIELAHHILVNHYHFPHQIVDFCIVTLAGALIGTLTWRWFRGTEKRPGNVKVEVLVVPLIILLTLVIDLKLIFVMTGVHINMLLIGIVAICLGIAWVVFKSLQWAASVSEAEKKVEVLKPTEEKPISFPEWENSIAVLPFANMSANPEQEYFCDGMADSIINALTHIKDLQVVARTSAFSFKGKEQDVREIGKKLNVNTVLEGSVQKADNRIRITAQLINVEDGYYLWSERFDRESEDVFAIQDEISLVVVDKLKPKLLGEEKARLVKRHTDNLEAYNLYLKGLYFYQMYTPKGIKEAFNYLEQALQKDPNYTMAYFGLARAYTTSSLFGYVPPKIAIPKAKEYIMKALEIDSTLGEAHGLLGYIHIYDYEWDWVAAERRLKQGLQLNPSSADIHVYYSFFLTVTRRHEEAIVEIKRAQELDPLSRVINRFVGLVLVWGSQYDRAIEELKMTLTMFPNDYLAHNYLGMAYQGKSMFEEAISEYEKAIDLSSGAPMLVVALAAAYNEIGKKAQAEKLFASLEQRSKQEYVPSLAFFYCHHLLRGDQEQAYEWLERAYSEHDGFLIWSIVFPYDPIRFPDEPKYKEILRKVGLE